MYEVNPMMFGDVDWLKPEDHAIAAAKQVALGLVGKEFETDRSCGQNPSTN